MTIRYLYSIFLLLLSFHSFTFSTQEWEAYFSTHALMVHIQDETSHQERIVFFPLTTLQETNMHDDEPNLCLLPISKKLFEEGMPVDRVSKYTVDTENPSECVLRIFELVNAGNNDQKMNVLVVGIKEYDKHYCFVLQPYLKAVAAKIVLSTRDPLEEHFNSNDDDLFDQLDEQGVFDNHPGPKKISWLEGIKMKYGGSFVYHVNNLCSFISKKFHKWFL